MKIKFDDRTVAALKPDPDRRIDVFDTDAKSDGLMLRITPAGVKTWLVRYRTDDGRQRRYVLGRYPGMMLAAARTAARTTRGQARDGEDPAGERRIAKIEARTQPLKTVGELSAVYFTACETGEWRPRGKAKRASTLAEERRLWAGHVKATFDDLRVEEVTPASIKKLLRTLSAAGKGTTSNRVRSLMRQVFNFAISERRIERNPVAGVDALKQETARERVVSDAELIELWRALLDPSKLKKPAKDGEKPEQVYVGAPVTVALRLALLTLARRAELTGMRRDELDLAQSTWTIPGARTKNGRSLVIPLATQAKTLIEAAIKLSDAGLEKDDPRSPYVFVSPRDRSKPITPAALSHATRDIRLALGLADIRPHDFRRTAASIMVSERLGVSPFLVGRILNHSSEHGGAAAVTLKHYALHDYAREKRLALQSWADLLTQIVSGKAKGSNVTPFPVAAA